MSQDETLMGQPLWRGFGIKPIKIVKLMLGTRSIYRVLKTEQKDQLLRSPEKGLKTISKISSKTATKRLKMKEFKFSPNVDWFPSIQAPSQVSSLTEILSVLLPCLCIGCSIYWGILPEQIIVQSGSGLLDPETLLRMKETMEASMRRRRLHRCTYNCREDRVRSHSRSVGRRKRNRGWMLIGFREQVRSGLRSLSRKSHLSGCLDQRFTFRMNRIQRSIYPDGVRNEEIGRSRPSLTLSPNTAK